jgi:hypothetical protein
VSDDERQGVLVPLVGVAEQLAVDHHEVVAEGWCGERIQGAVTRHQVNLRVPSQVQPAREVIFHGVDVGELPGRESHRRSSCSRAGELTIHDQARYEQQQRKEGYSELEIQLVMRIGQRFEGARQVLLNRHR